MNCYSQEKIYPSETEGKMVLLYKWRNNKDPSNYHPITYITINMKIFTSNITNKIKSINTQTIPLIQQNQLSYVKNTFESKEWIILNQNIQEHLNHQKQYYILYYYVKKVYDSVIHKMIINQLKKK